MLLEAMADSPTVHVTIDGERQRQRIVYTNGDSESLLLSCAGAGLFRLEESSLLGEAQYHDIIRASSKADGSLEFRGVVALSGFHTEEWILSKSLIESPEFRSVLAWVMSVGGNWEQAFGGLLLVHVPPHHADTARDRVNSFQPKSNR